MEAGSAIGNVLRVDFSAMSFYNRTHNGQSHSQPLGRFYIAGIGHCVWPDDTRYF